MTNSIPVSSVDLVPVLIFLFGFLLLVLITVFFRRNKAVYRTQLRLGQIVFNRNMHDIECARTRPLGEVSKVEKRTESRWAILKECDNDKMFKQFWTSVPELEKQVIESLDSMEEVK